MGICLMRLIDENGRPLDAEYLIEADGDGLAVVVRAAAECRVGGHHGTPTTTVL